MKFNKPMCLLGIKTFGPFEVLFPKEHFFHKKELFNDFFAIFLFIIFTIAPICEMFGVNHFLTNMIFFKCIDFARFCILS